MRNAIRRLARPKVDIERCPDLATTKEWNPCGDSDTRGDEGTCQKDRENR